MDPLRIDSGHEPSRLELCKNSVMVTICHHQVPCEHQLPCSQKMGLVHKPVGEIQAQCVSLEEMRPRTSALVVLVVLGP